MLKFIVIQLIEKRKEYLINYSKGMISRLKKKKELKQPE